MTAADSSDGREGWALLSGGTSNAGGVFRVGDEVRRPHRANIEALDLVARHLRAHQIQAPTYRGLDDAGNDRLTYIDGDVPVAPFPTWSLTIDSLTSTAQLLRRFHDTTRTLAQPDDAVWDRTFADPRGGPVIGHNDASPDNTVFRDGVAVGFIDLDYAAPTDPLLDLAHFLRMWVPLGTSSSGGNPAATAARRMSAALRGYGTAPSDGLAAALGLSLDQAEMFVRRNPSPSFDLLSPDYFSQRREELLTALTGPRTSNSDPPDGK